jgi:hybrid cluster-associated redox disulfide protein
MAQKITKKMSFAEIIQKNPKAAEILFENGMHCIGCAMAINETLEQGAIAHGIDPDKIVKEINNSGKTKEKIEYKKIMKN